MSMSFLRALTVWLAVLLLAVELPSCTKDGGGLMLEIRQEGLDIDQLEVVIETEDGRVLVHHDYEVDKKSFPATVGILNDVDHTNLWVQVAGFEGGSVRDVRRLLVRYVPALETRLLSVVLTARCSQFVVADGAHSFELLCEEGQTCSSETGTCESAKIDAGNLPIWDGGQSGVGGSPTGSGGMGGDSASGGSESGGGSGGGAPSGGQGGQCSPSDKSCSSDRRSVLECVDGVSITTETCQADEMCSPVTLECVSVEPACEGQSQGFEFCGADGKRYACGESGLTSETEEKPCAEGVSCIEEDGKAVCQSECDEDNGGCDPEVTCVDSLEGPICGDCPGDGYSLDEGQTCSERTDCAPGFEVAQDGDSSEDRTCTACESGFFSTAKNAKKCEPWSCPTGSIPSGPGTTTTNQPCVPLGLGQWGTSGEDSLAGMVRDSEGNIVLAGTTTGSLLGDNAGGQDVFILKLSSSLSYVWGLQIGSSFDDTASGVSVSPNGEVFVVGMTAGVFGGIAAQGQDGFLTKLTSGGGLAWTNLIGTSLEDEALAVVVAEATRVVVGGSTRGALSATNEGEQDAFLRVFDADSGAIVYTEQFGTRADDSVVALVAGKAGKFFSVANGAWTWGGLGMLLDADESVNVRGYERSGGSSYSEDWEQEFGAGTETRAVAATYHPSTDRIHIVGSTNGRLRDPVTSMLLENAGGHDVFIRSFAEDEGAGAFGREFGTGAEDVGRGIAVSESGQIWVCGTTAGTMGEASAGGVDLFVKPYTAAGGVGTPTQLGTTGTDVCRGVVAAGTDVFLAGDTTGTLSGYTAFGGSDVFVIKPSLP